MNYLHWDEKKIDDFSEKNVFEMYDRGYVFTRKGKGVMQQTRSVRINLAKFELLSENRRILKKVDGVLLASRRLPLKEYDHQLGMGAKYFYDKKFGPGVMSAQKVKEMLVDPIKSNFNALLEYRLSSNSNGTSENPLGYAICYVDRSLLHYSYPFYHIDRSPRDMGLGMMTLAIDYAKQNALKYIYLGSLQRPGDSYKLQFEGLEWFEGGPNGSNAWNTNLEKVKSILSAARTL